MALVGRLTVMKTYYQPSERDPANNKATQVAYLCQRNADGSLDTTTCPGGTVNGVNNVQPGYYALGPNQIQAMDPMGIGVNQAVLSLLQKMSSFAQPWLSTAQRRAYRI